MMIAPAAVSRPTSCLPNPVDSTVDPVMAKAIVITRKMLAKHGAQDWVLCLAGPRYATGLERLFLQLHEGKELHWEPLAEVGQVALIGMHQDGEGLRNQLYPIPFGLWICQDPAFALVHIPLRCEGESGWKSLEIFAAPSGEEVAQMLEKLDRDGERGRVLGLAPIMRQIGEDTLDLERTVLEGEKPLLAEKTQLAVQREIRDFFSPKWRKLVKKNRIPYRRGVLLFGPPGNGKTSAVRDCLHAMPEVAAIFCRPTSTHDMGETLENAVATWRRTAPAVLVLEDIDSLFENYPLSAFLNMLDGVVPMKESGLLLIATTNNPEDLPPALSNRPGRFDVAIRFGLPDAKLRQAHFERELDGAETSAMADPDWKNLIHATQRLSFAHLNEIMIRSGLQAARDQRIGRSPDDLIESAKRVAKGALDADGGFKDEGEVFGFGGGEGD